MNLDFLKIEQETESEFKLIAEKLFNNFAIQNHESKYRLTEIEFYWNSPTHKDDSTYKRKHTDPKNGAWFFHYSGVDIALKNNNGFGGILIRGIYRYNSEEKEQYKGPMVCAMKLFSGTNAFNETIQTRIVEHTFGEAEITSSKRKRLGKNAKESGTDKLRYNFSIKPNG